MPSKSEWEINHNQKILSVFLNKGGSRSDTGLPKTGERGYLL